MAGLPTSFVLGYLTILSILIWIALRRPRSKQSPPPWFSQPHISRDLYFSLLNLDPTPPPSILISSLLTRASFSLDRKKSLSSSKTSLSKLWSSGLIGHQLWDSLLMAEIELDLEFQSIEEDALSFGFDLDGFRKLVFQIVEHRSIQSIWKDIQDHRPDSRSSFEIKTFEVPLLSLLNSVPSQPIPSQSNLTNKNKWVQEDTSEKELKQTEEEVLKNEKDPLGLD